MKIRHFLTILFIWVSFLNIGCGNEDTIPPTDPEVPTDCLGLALVDDSIGSPCSELGFSFPYCEYELAGSFALGTAEK